VNGPGPQGSARMIGQLMLLVGLALVLAYLVVAW
jgi:flagellar biogenesis protein FliO